MKLHDLLLLKCVFIGVALLTIVNALAADEGLDTLKAPQSKLTQTGRATSVRTKPNVQHSPDESRVELERLHPQPKQQIKQGKNGNAFGSTSWYVPPPPPPPPPPAPPPVPTAPTVPFTFLGLYEESSKTIVMLIKGDQVFTVSVGDVIENTYRIDHVERGSVEITYLPLNIKQSINTGNSL
jgi:hypothetical protein